MTLGEHKVENIKAVLEKLKTYVTVNGGRLADAEARKIICMLQGSAESLKSMYEKELAAAEPPPKMSVEQIMAWTKAEAHKLDMKIVIGCVLPLLAKRAAEICSAPDDQGGIAVSNIVMPAAEPALAITAVAVDVVGTSSATSDGLTIY